MQKVNKFVFLSAIYIALSALTVIISNKNGSLDSWLLQGFLGPIWHLSGAISVLRTLNENLEGVIRVSIGDISCLVMYLFVWGVGLFQIKYIMTLERRKNRALFISFFIIFWLIIGAINFFLYCLHAV